MANAGIFETVLATNKQYVDAINNNASVQVQENLLAQCRVVFKTMILDTGLAIEYGEYCRQKSSR